MIQERRVTRASEMDTGGFSPARVERLRDAQFDELRLTVARWLAQVEALSARRLELVDLLLILREGRGVDLDAGRLREVGDQGVGHFVRPDEDVELAR